MQFLSEYLVSSDYRTRITQDLRDARVCRFLVAYISASGIDAIGRPELLHVLRDDNSFGVGSISCACGWRPLFDLQQALGESTPRLKYFMDPRVKQTEEPDDIVLFHSKLVYLHQPERRASVVYLGSHNWTSKALGPGSPRNAEASIRLELPFSQEHLSGEGPSIASQVNRHLLTAYRAPACLRAIEANRDRFQQWVQWVCDDAPPSEMEEVTIVLAVHSGSPTRVPASQWANLAGQGIYLPTLSEHEGTLLREDSDRVLVMAWQSRQDLVDGRPPVLLLCHLSTQDPALNSKVRGTNKASTPIEGFQGVIADNKQLLSSQRGSVQPGVFVRIWSGRTVEYFDFDYPSARTASSAVDGGVKPKYRFLLEVDEVVLPAQADIRSNTEMSWQPASFAVARSRNEAKLQRIQGYLVEPELSEYIRASLVDTFAVDLSKARALPRSEYDPLRAGLRLSNHPLHDTFIGPDIRQSRAQFYSSVSQGALAADIDAVGGSHETSQKAPSEDGVPHIRRVSRVYSTKLDRLRSLWAETMREGRQPE